MDWIVLTDDFEVEMEPKKVLKVVLNHHMN